MILVTGGAGYIGSHCVLELLKNGFEVVIFDNLELGHKETVKTLQGYGKVEFVQGDLKDFAQIAHVFGRYKIQAVIHFAAYSQVAESVQNPQKYFANNVGGSENLLKAMAANKIDKIVFSSTAATYGEPMYTPIDEKHQQIPINPYGESKLAVEKLLHDYDATYGIKSAILRYFNVAGADSQGIIGEWHSPETHLIPNILKSTLGEGSKFEMYGEDYNTKDGTCVRDYINIEDLSRAHVLALKYLSGGGKTDCFNLGTKDGNSVKEVFAICEEVTGQKIPVNKKPRRAGDPAVLVANNEKARKILKWCPEKSLKNSIATAYAWEKRLAELLSVR